MDWESTGNDYPRSETKTWYCGACSKPIRRESIKANERCKCGHATFRLQPKLHTTGVLWELTEDDETFLRVQKISTK